ncbi:DUF3325 domain-containing protein [Methylorubrum salsuginis]|uniref:Iron uptake protein n=1 Tax=Methylorubrum salsuginis TaxID=414703 RepID=A0A1I4HA40_9HYPH|nr:DUF3325 domain-containing protein [Methylorubrum salsuginis]SFL38640.1 Protein of unknown function [Methylorubrum salsuginis]
MTLSILLLNLGLSFAALSALCLSLDRHHKDILRSKPGRSRIVLLRALGWTGLGLCLLIAGEAEGWDFGPVQWIGTLTGAGLALVLLVSYRPRSIGWAAAAAFGLAMTAGLLQRLA